MILTEKQKEKPKKQTAKKPEIVEQIPMYDYNSTDLELNKFETVFKQFCDTLPPLDEYQLERTGIPNELLDNLKNTDNKVVLAYIDLCVYICRNIPTSNIVEKYAFKPASYEPVTKQLMFPAEIVQIQLPTLRDILIFFSKKFDAKSFKIDDNGTAVAVLQASDTVQKIAYDRDWLHENDNIPLIQDMLEVLLTQKYVIPEIKRKAGVNV
jgi:hypothetical protein